MTHNLDDKTATFIRENMPRLKAEAERLKVETIVCKWPMCRCYIPSQPTELNMPDAQWARRNCPDEASYRDLIAAGGLPEATAPASAAPQDDGEAVLFQQIVNEYCNLGEACMSDDELRAALSAHTARVRREAFEEAADIAERRQTSDTDIADAIREHARATAMKDAG